MKNSEPGASSPSAGSKPVFWCIPHTHWEGAVFRTREAYLAMGLPHILMALKLLKERPDYRFVLDQAAYVKPFLERYPEETAAFRQFIAEGRLQITGGMDVMPDVNVPCGEATVRQILYGKGFFQNKLGVDVTTSWELDTFGHNAQMPQILKRAGFQSMWFFRGVPHLNLPSEFRWQGLDGTQIDVYWLPCAYVLAYGSPKQPDKFAEFFAECFAKLDPYTRGAHRVGMAGHDVSAPELHLPSAVEEFNRRPDAPFTIRLATPAEYEAVSSRERREPVIVTGELNPIFQGTYSSRIEIKQWIRSMERLLLTAEQWAVMTRWLGAPTDVEGLWSAWEPVLFNEAHDLAAGVMTDVVYADTIRSYEYAKRTATELLDQSWESIAARIDTRGDGIPVVVWNTLSWERSDVAEVEVSFIEPGVLAVGVVDPDGHPIPVQIIESQAHADGGIRQARIAFLAAVPALGYAVYRVLPKKETAATTGLSDPNVLENEQVRLTFVPGTGAVQSIRCKKDNWEALAGPANVVTCELDKGDLWELYQGLDPSSNTAMSRLQSVPQPGQAQFSSEQTGSTSGRNGPVFSEHHAEHPFGNGTFATTVRLYHGLRRVDMWTRLLNNDRAVRYQALFPTSIKDGRSVHEIPFGAIERPEAIEFPAQTWVDTSDGKHGVAILNDGLPGNVTTGGTMMLSLLRAHTLGAYNYVGGYEPGMCADSGLQLGREFTLHYALLTHDGDWRSAQVWREGQGFNHPFSCRKTTAHHGELPSRWGFMTISPSNVVVSSLKPGVDGATVLRVYEASGKATKGVRIQLHVPVIKVGETDLLERPIQPITVEQNALHFDLGPFEIKTLQLNLQPEPPKGIKP